MVDKHPLPKLDDLTRKLRGGTFFSKLDLVDAYLQLELDDNRNKYVSLILLYSSTLDVLEIMIHLKII